MIARMLSTLANAYSVISDSFWTSVTVLLHGNGSDNGTNSTFLDSSSNALTITPTGTPTQGSLSPFGDNWSTLFDATNSYITLPSNAGFAMGTGDFTIECYLKYNVLPAVSDERGGPFQISPNQTGNNYQANSIAFGMTRTQQWFNWCTTGADVWAPIGVVGSVKLHTWYHCALVRVSGVLKFYVNGILQYSAANTANITATNCVLGHSWSQGTQKFPGNLSNFRIVKGTALYTTDFTPPSTNLTVVAGTSLLTCQSNNFKDNSTNNFALTPAGTPKVSPMSPFAGDPIIRGGSVLFNGTTDKLDIASNSAFDAGSSDFTIEAFVYGTLTTVSRIISRGATDASSNKGWAFGYGTIWGGGTKINLSLQSNEYVSNAVTIPNNTWNHIAVTRSGTTVTFFLNGVSVGTVTSSISLNVTDPICIGARANYNRTSSIEFMNGILSNVRFIKGAALYTTDFTTPTSELTNVTNTQLLLLGSNAQIVDNAKLQDWQVIGNAKVTTSNKRFGSGSIKLDAGGYLQTPINNQISMVAGATWTIEMWICRTGTLTEANSAVAIGDYAPTAGTHNWGLGVVSSNIPRFTWYAGTNNVCQGTSVLTLNQWYHLSVVSASGSLSLYLNGVKEGSSITLTAPSSSLSVLTIGQFNNSAAPLLIDDLRITNGVARYSSNFTPTQNPNISLDTLSSYNVLQLDGEGSNNGNFLDSSSNNFAITKVGTPTQGSFTPFSPNWSNQFNGTSGYLTLGGQSNFAFGAGDFTIETFIKLDTNTAWQWIYDSKQASTMGLYPAIQVSNVGKLIYSINGGATATGVSTLNAGVWYHIAVCKTGGFLKVYLNGNQEISIVDTNTYLIGASAPVIGGYGYNRGAELFKGSISNLRVVKGTALYTTNFTPPTQALTAVAGTSLLTCQSNRFVDNSTNNFAITATGAPQVVPQSPFAKVKYSPTVHGGSLQFNGSTDYLSQASPCSLGTEDFTLEFWMNPDWANGGSNSAAVFSQKYDDTRNGVVVYKNGNTPTKMTVRFGSGVGTDFNTTSSITSFVWQHWALVRSGNTVKWYLNGKLDATGSTALNLNDTIGSLLVGLSQTWGGYFKGYISNLRLIKGTALYLTDFVPSTEPLTPITNTQLLLSGANGSVVDQSMSTNLTVLGTASISASQKKFGTSSMYFPGSVGNYISMVNTATIPRTGNFSIEFWIYVINYPSTYTAVLDARDTGGTTNTWQIQCNAGAMKFEVNGANVVTFNSFPTTTWTHVSLTRVNGIIKGYLNGTFVSEVANTTDLTKPLSRIGMAYDGTNPFNGYIDDLRVTIGASRPVFPIPTGEFLNS